MALVAGMNLVPSPATGKTAFLIFMETPLDLVDRIQTEIQLNSYWSVMYSQINQMSNLFSTDRWNKSHKKRSGFGNWLTLLNLFRMLHGFKMTIITYSEGSFDD